MPKFKDVLEDSAMQPFDHLASATVRTFELVYSRGSTEILLSAKTLDDMGRYADLFSQVYGELELAEGRPTPALLAGLPAYRWSHGLKSRSRGPFVAAPSIKSSHTPRTV